MPKDYSKKELQLIYELSNNARSPLNHIAKRLKASQQGINYRIKQFQEQGTIMGFFTIFDYANLDFDCFRVYFRLNYQKKEQFESIIQHFLTNTFVLSVIPSAGRWDLIVLFASKNASKFNKILQVIIDKFPNIFENIEILTTISSHEFGRKYLVDYSSHIGTTIYGGDKIASSLDSVDKKIISELYESPRSSYVKIASRLKLNPKTIISKIKSLEAKGVIKGYSLNLDCYKFDYLPYKILIKYHHLSKEENELLKFCHQHKNIIRLNKTLGFWNLELDIEVPDTLELNNILSEIKRKYNSVIFEIEIVQLLRAPKISFIPKSFFLE
ncbi:Lrp/AsnC family transcriptional regulator [Candidatus Woesearchaeota archaeon]|nr:Lrp/AsnC family transcriptional regulator [Candidatus Woesearchaeota archaeon]